MVKAKCYLSQKYNHLLRKLYLFQELSYSFCIFVMTFFIFVFYGWVWQDSIGGLGFSGKALLERLIIIDFTATLYNHQQQGEQLPKNALRNIQNVFIQQGFLYSIIILPKIIGHMVYSITFYRDDGFLMFYSSYILFSYICLRCWWSDG